MQATLMFTRIMHLYLIFLFSILCFNLLISCLTKHLLTACKQHVLDILATLFSIWKHQKNNLLNFLSSSNIWKKLKFYIFFIGISNLPLASQSNLCHIIWIFKKILAKALHLLSSTWIFFLQFSQILGLIQVIEGNMTITI